jgi:hypothetical protein
MSSYSSRPHGTERRSTLVTGGRPRQREATRGMLMLRGAGAIALLAMGATHLQQYVGAAYSSIPTIGTLFLLNFAGALVIALGLLLPLERLLPRHSTAIVSLLSVGGVVIAAASIAFLLISESTPLFGFREAGYRTPIVVALIAEAAAVILLGAYSIAPLRELSSARD